MMVTFVSQCEHKALNRTRRVLDAFANRIGTNTWQTVITDEGLQAVKKLLRKTATKNTAVSCHWIRSRSRSELVWIVGSRVKFNYEGFVPVNRTQKTIWQTDMTADWNLLPLIKSLTALAALFHDWGKASEYFQYKLSNNVMAGDPLRHEWISTLFLNAFVNGEPDTEWLTRLAEGKIEAGDLQNIVNGKHGKEKNKNKPLHKLPPAASLLAWLIVSHHRLPLIKQDSHIGAAAKQYKDLFKLITQKWGYENKYDQQAFDDNLSRCFDYPKGLPSQSAKWRQYTQRNAKKLLEQLPLLEQAIEDGSWRLILHHARLSLMLGDHYYSSQDKDSKWQSSLDLYANTDKSQQLKQRLDEHLVMVAKQAVRNVHLLPAFEGRHEELQRAFDIKPLKQKSPNAFKWQDIAVTKINAWREQHKDKQNAHQFGFFAVNMASTGQGKTFANAKIMRALSIDGESLRYILALGLRTLTLQTGDEYRDRIKLGDDELAVLIGSRAVKELHDQKKQKQVDEELTTTGSESEQSLLDNDIDFSANIPDAQLATVLTTLKSRQFLYAPVLTCTIDHLMAATETKRGGRYILPALRLMSSDLVIDEIDDFDGKDLIAIGRLIHLAGMLGRKVMISSATIPPDLAEGYFNAYQEGWALFAKHRGRSLMVGCGWMDEKTTQVESIMLQSSEQARESYQQWHQQFVGKRIQMLLKQVVKRKAEIIPVISDDKQTLTETYFKTIQNTIIEKHQQHCFNDEQSVTQLSFGLVRMANISPCVQLSQYLLNAQWPDSVDVRCMAYHSQQTLIMRNEQEKHLDQVLKRKISNKELCTHPVIRQHLQSTTAKKLIFILVATPVEEVGRDHDFDWAVVEPSSYRSFIQLAGRILRHRQLLEDLAKANIGILQFNLKGFLRQEKIVFRYPGYENEKNILKTHDLTQLVDVASLAQCLDAQARIAKPDTLQPETQLADLEHQVIHQLLTNYQRLGPETLQGWLQGCWWLTAVPQLLVKFRAGNPQLTLFLIKQDDDWKFAEKDKLGKPVVCEQIKHIQQINQLTDKEQQRLWLYRDYNKLLEQTNKPTVEQAALVYGEINMPDYENAEFVYSDQFGLTKK